MAVIKQLEIKVAPLIERIKENNLQEDFLENVRAFLIEFDEVRDAFDNLPLEDGVPTGELTEKEKKNAIELIPKLIKGLEGLAAAHALMIETLKKGMDQNTERMELMRKAKKIFDKFVKAPKQDPRFFDKRM
ncbi:MAG: hypothetical protein WCX65_17475 [bacterium]